MSLIIKRLLNQQWHRFDYKLIIVINFSVTKARFGLSLHVGSYLGLRILVKLESVAYEKDWKIG